MLHSFRLTKFSGIMLVSIFLGVLANCSLEPKSLVPSKELEEEKDDQALEQEAQLAFENLHAKSESIYDGGGTWGQTQFGYRMMMRDSYWRADAYRKQLIQNPNKATYRSRLVEVVNFLRQAQDQGGKNVFGIPADPKNPEFGSQILLITQNCPECVSNGWIVDLPAQVGIESLYYDHGYSLYTLAKAYVFLKDPELLANIRKGADWILNQPTTLNINYLSALAKGLAAAYDVTQDTRYLEHAVKLHNDVILPHQQANGEWDDAHNRKLEYHGFIVSGLIALKASLPKNYPFTSKLDDSLDRALKIMSQRNLTEASNPEQTWIGTNLRAWSELKELRALTSSEANALQHCLKLAVKNIPLILQENQFRLQKGLYSYYSVGLH